LPDKCDVCGVAIDDEFETECPACGSYWCGLCERFVSPDGWNGGEICLDCKRDRDRDIAEAYYEMF